MRSRSSRFRNLVATYWQPTVYYGLLIVFFGLLLWFQLGTLLGGYSAAEQGQMQAGSSLRAILDNPVNAPFNLLVYLFDLAPFVDTNSLLPVRAAATVFALLTLTTFYWLVRHWHGERSAILGTVVFGCSAWFLHTARLGTPEVLMFLPLGLIACAVWLKRTENPLVLLVGFAMAGLFLYVPGMVWFLLAAAIWQGRTIVRLFREHALLMGLGSVGLLILISPIVWAMYNTPSIAKVLAGLPANYWPRILDFLSNLAQVPYHLFVRGPLDPLHWLGRLPILDIFSIIMLLLGGYLYARHYKLARAKILATVLAVGCVLVGLDGMVSLSVVMPFVYILVAAGIGFMLDRWQAVFPRNVIAQALSVGLISLAVIAASWYGFRHYFVAWPNAPATRQVFIIK